MSNSEQNDHEVFMRQCISLARLAKQRGDSAVGSVIVQNNRIIAEGIEAGKTQKDITYHAEIEAVRHARRLLDTHDLSDCIMYATHEPCIMCSYVIRHSGIKTVVIGVTSREVGGFTSKLPLLTDTTIKRWKNPPEIVLGILEKECLLL